VFDSPEAMRTAAWQAMARGVADRRSPARHPTLATIGPDGPQARTVVLRGWADDVAEVHTDAASAKLSELRADPRAALHVWLPRQDMQIRLSATVGIVLNDADRWARIPEGARIVYGGDPTPGVPLGAAEDFRPGRDFARFAVLRLSVIRADLVHLGADLHRRAILRRDADGWTGGWVAP
jgi:hypothetical protein